MSAKIPLENKAFERWPIFYKVIVAKNADHKESRKRQEWKSAVTANISIAAFLKNNQKKKSVRQTNPNTPIVSG